MSPINSKHHPSFRAQQEIFTLMCSIDPVLLSNKQVYASLSHDSLVLCISNSATAGAIYTQVCAQGYTALLRPLRLNAGYLVGIPLNNRSQAV